MLSDVDFESRGGGGSTLQWVRDAMAALERDERGALGRAVLDWGVVEEDEGDGGMNVFFFLGE